MLNYMKSEWYRITHASTIYVFTAIMAGLTLLINVVLFIFNMTDSSFRYGNVSFSLSLLASGMALIFLVGAVVVSLLFSGDRKNGILKNAVAFGISREKIFIAKCIVSSLISICSLVVILVVYIGSAVLLLEPGVEPSAVFILLRGIGYILITAVAFEVLAIAFYNFFDNDVLAYSAWYTIMGIIPGVCSLLGMKIDLFRKIAAWMPYNYLNGAVYVNMGRWECLWETSQGAAKCLISGGIGLVIFLVMGLIMCKKKEL